METQEQDTSSPYSKKHRLSNQQIEYLKRVVDENGDLEWINEDPKVRHRTLSKWLKDPVFVERLSDLHRRMVWNSIFEAARLLPTSLNILYRHMTSDDPNVSVRATIEGIKLFSMLVEKEKGGVKFTDIGKYQHKIGQIAKKREKIKNPASFGVRISRPKKAKSRLLPEKTGFEKEIRSITKKNIAAPVKLEEKGGLILPIEKRFKESTKPLNIQYGSPSPKYPPIPE